MDAGFFRGTSADQDNRFVNKQKKLMKSMKFAEGLNTKIDIKKVNMETIKPWISEKITKMLGFEDDVVIEYVFNSLEERFPDPKLLQINLTGFLNGKNSRLFLAELWPLMISAQEQASGIPEIFLESKKEEIRLRQEQLAASKSEEPKDSKEESVKEKNGSDEKLPEKSRRSRSNSPRSRSRRSTSRSRRSRSPRRRRSRSPMQRSRRSPRHRSHRSRSPRKRSQRSPSPRSRHRRSRSPKPRRSPLRKPRRRSSSSRHKRTSERKTNKSRSRSSSGSPGSDANGTEEKVIRRSINNGTHRSPPHSQQSKSGDAGNDKVKLPPDPWARNPRQPVAPKIREVMPEPKPEIKEREQKRERQSSSDSGSDHKKSMSTQMKRRKSEKKKKSKTSKKKKSKKHKKHKKVDAKENENQESDQESTSPKITGQNEVQIFSEKPETEPSENEGSFATERFEKQKLKNREDLDMLFNNFLSENNLKNRSKSSANESSSASDGETNEEDLRKRALASLSK